MGDQTEVAPTMSGHEVSETSSALEPVPRTITNETSPPDPLPQMMTGETSAPDPEPRTITGETSPPETTSDESSDPDPIRLGHFRAMERDFYRVAMEGDWEGWKKILMDDNNGVDLKSKEKEGENALYLAANCGRTEFVVEMVKIFSEEQVKVLDVNDRNVLHQVAIASGVAAAKAIVDKCPWMAQEKNKWGDTPLSDAALCRHPSRAKEMVEYLYSITNPDAYLDSETAPKLIVAVTSSGCYNVTLKILEKRPKLALATWDPALQRGTQPCISSNVQNMKGRFSMSLHLSLQHFQWKKMSLYGRKYLYHVLQKEEKAFVKDYFMCTHLTHLMPILHLATENGAFKLVVLCLKYLPEIIEYTRNDWEYVLHVAVKHRQVEVFNHLINLVGKNFGVYSETVEGRGNILHMAACLAPTPQLHSIAGPAFQLQRELQWFKAVESLVIYAQIDEKNSKEQKPIDLFYEEHGDLIKDAKQWIKDTSNSCMVVAALVATVAFASMISVPGGNDSGTGKPVLSKNKVFIIFSISNALSMISSAIALLMFLSLQTSRFTTEDFLAIVPKNLLRGLLSLFFAVATMMIAFGTAIGMAIQTRIKWAYIAIIIVACIPTIIFTKLQLPLLFQTLGVTSGTTLLPKQKSPRKGSLLEEVI